MIKCERGEDSTAVEIVGNNVTIASELHCIFESLASNEKSKSTLDTVFLSLADFYTKEEMIELIDKAFETKEFMNSPVGEVINGLLNKIKEHLEEYYKDDGTTTTN